MRSFVSSPVYCSSLALLALPAAAQAKSTITLSGSTSVAPLATKLAKAYVKAKPGKAKFRSCRAGPTSASPTSPRGRVTLGMASRDPQPSDPGGLVFNRIARDGVCIATHPGNRIGNISQDTVQAIFSGPLRIWSQVPGARRAGRST